MTPTGINITIKTDTAAKIECFFSWSELGTTWVEWQGMREEYRRELIKEKIGIKFSYAYVFNPQPCFNPF